MKSLTDNGFKNGTTFIFDLVGRFLIYLFEG